MGAHGWELIGSHGSSEYPWEHVGAHDGKPWEPMALLVGDRHGEFAVERFYGDRWCSPWCSPRVPMEISVGIHAEHYHGASHGDLCKPMRNTMSSHRSPWVPVGCHGRPWCSPWDIMVSPWAPTVNPMGAHGNPWKSMVSHHGFPWDEFR